MKTLTLQSIATEFPQVLAAARKLEANPQKTISQRQDADELRQRMEAKGWGGLLSSAVLLLREQYEQTYPVAR